MIRSMVSIDDFLSYLQERSEQSEFHDFFFDIDRMTEVVKRIPNHKFLNISFKFGNKTWILKEIDQNCGLSTEINLFGERFLNFGFVIYRIEQGCIRDLSYYSDGLSFGECFLRKILKPENWLTSKQIVDLYQMD